MTYDRNKTYVVPNDAWWGISYLTPAGYDTPELQASARLNVTHYDNDAPNADGGRGTITRHPEFDGLLFANIDEAAAFAVEHGLLEEFDHDRTTLRGPG